MGVRSTMEITREEAKRRLLEFIPTAPNNALEDMLLSTCEFENFIITDPEPEQVCCECGRPHRSSA